MTEAKMRLESIAGRQYIPAPEGLKLWVVIKQWPGGLVEHVAAYFTESLARAHAGDLVGRDGSLITLQTIDVKDAPGGQR